jgi:hypothetical protein
MKSLNSPTVPSIPSRARSPERLALESLRPGRSIVLYIDEDHARRLQSRLHAQTTLRFSANKISGGYRFTRHRGQRQFRCVSQSSRAIYLRAEGPLLRADLARESFFMTRASARRLATALLEFAR